MMDFAARRHSPPALDYSWTGILTVPVAGDYTLMVQPALTGGSEGGGTVPSMGVWSRGPAAPASVGAGWLEEVVQFASDD